MREWDGERVLCSGNLYMLAVDPERVDADWLGMWLRSEEGRAAMQHRASGGRTPVLTVAGLREVRLALPPIEEQRALGDRRRAAAAGCASYLGARLLRRDDAAISGCACRIGACLLRLVNVGSRGRGFLAARY